MPVITCPLNDLAQTLSAVALSSGEFLVYTHTAMITLHAPQAYRVGPTPKKLGIREETNETRWHAGPRQAPVAHGLHSTSARENTPQEGGTSRLHCVQRRLQPIQAWLRIQIWLAYEHMNTRVESSVRCVE